MDATGLLPFPNASAGPIERDMAEIEAAIAMVANGLATRVHLVGLFPSDAVAAAGLARAREEHVTFGLDRGSTGALVVTLGPRR